MLGEGEEGVNCGELGLEGQLGIWFLLFLSVWNLELTPCISLGCFLGGLIVGAPNYVI